MSATPEALAAISKHYVTKLIFSTWGGKPNLDDAGDEETATSWCLFKDARVSSVGSGSMIFRRGQTVTDPTVVSMLRSAGADIRPNASKSPPSTAIKQKTKNPPHAVSE